MISSGAANVATPYNTVYAASKFAVEALADGTRIEVASQGVHVSVVNPGTTVCLFCLCHLSLLNEKINIKTCMWYSR